MERQNTVQRKEEERLFVNSFNPNSLLTIRTRVRQVLHTHQGRDKIFKVILYYIRLWLWVRSKRPNVAGMDVAAGAASTAVLVKTLNSLTDSRRMFRIGRFVAEFVKMRATLIKCSEIQLAPAGVHLQLQFQMLVDIVARALMCVKSVIEDVIFVVQHGLLNSDLEPKLLRTCGIMSLPVLIIDLYLNTMRLAQGILDARYAQPVLFPASPTGSIGRRGSLGFGASKKSPPLETTTILEKRGSGSSPVPLLGSDLVGGNVGKEAPPRPLSPRHPLSHSLRRVDSHGRIVESPTIALPGGVVNAQDRTFSLLTTYRKVDALRGQLASSASPAPSVAVSRSTSNLQSILAASTNRNASTRPTSSSPPPPASVGWAPLSITTAVAPASASSRENVSAAAVRSSAETLHLPSSTEDLLSGSGNTQSSNASSNLDVPAGGLVSSEDLDDVNPPSKSATASPVSPPAPVSEVALVVTASSTNPNSGPVKSPSLVPSLSPATLITYNQCANKSRVQGAPTTPCSGPLNKPVFTASADKPSVAFSNDVTTHSARADSSELAVGPTTAAGGLVVDTVIPGHEDDLIVNSYTQLLWSDFELHWVCVTQFKLILDLTVCSARVYDLQGADGFISVCGLVSGLVSVYRVLSYGR